MTKVQKYGAAAVVAAGAVWFLFLRRKPEPTPVTKPLDTFKPPVSTVGGLDIERDDPTPVRAPSTASTGPSSTLYRGVAVATTKGATYGTYNPLSGVKTAPTSGACCSTCAKPSATSGIKVACR